MTTPEDNPHSDAHRLRTEQAIFTGEIRDLAAQLDRVSRGQKRVIIGLTGEPGAGKSTLSAYLAGALGDRAAVVPFDGFHLASSLLQGTDLRHRRGAIDTFDLAGYRRIIERLRKADEPVVYVPAFVRELEEPIAAAIAITHDVPVVLTEGNYLLSDHPDLVAARSMLDEVWYVECAPNTRSRRLIERHIRYGKSPAAAAAWAAGSDESNATQIRASRNRADLVVRIHEELATFGHEAEAAPTPVEA